MNLRTLAKGQACQLRIPGVCNHNPETTVLCHIRRGGIAGVGQKPPDICGVWGCSDCHALIDGRAQTRMTRAEVDSIILEGLLRTLAELTKLGAIRW